MEFSNFKWLVIPLVLLGRLCEIIFTYITGYGINCNLKIELFSKA